MTRPLKIIFIEEHFDTASYTVNKLLPQLVYYEFKNFFYERGPSVTYDKALEETAKLVQKISDDISQISLRDDPEELEAAELMLNNFNETLLLLRTLEARNITYKSVDTSLREERDLGYFSGETVFTEEELEAINLASSKAMAKAYLDAEENTFGIMGYGHAEQVIEEILKHNQKDDFIFIFPYNQKSLISDEDREFIRKAEGFIIPVICLDFELGGKDAQNVETVSTILQEKLEHPRGHRPGI